MCLISLQSHLFNFSLKLKPGLLNLVELGLTGKEAENLLDSVGLTANKNAIPNDPQKPWITSGIRLGTPACTTRGFKEAEFYELGKIIASVLKNPKDETVSAQNKKKVEKFCADVSVY